MVMVAVVADVKLTGKVVSAGSVPWQQSLSHDRQDTGSASDSLHWLTGHVVQVIVILFFVAPEVRFSV